MTDREAPRKLKGLGNLVDLWRDNPQTDAEKILKLVEEVLYEGTHDEPERQKEPINSTYIGYDDRPELIGKENTIIKARHQSLEKYKNNPYGIPINIFEKCPSCGKVGISNINIKYNPNSTTVYQRFRHEIQEHRVFMEVFEGRLDWKEILEKKLEDRITNSNERHNLDEVFHHQPQKVERPYDDEEEEAEIKT